MDLRELQAEYLRQQREFFGFLSDVDREGIFDILETSDIFSTKQKKRYGIHRR
jgi:hypothetical protein